MKKIKISFALVVVMLAAAYTTKAQSLEKQLRDELEKRKQRREAVLSKAKEQHKQQQEGGRITPVNNGTGQGNNATPGTNQKTSEIKPDANLTASTPSATQQNNPGKKEDTNEN